MNLKCRWSSLVIGPALSKKRPQQFPFARKPLRWSLTFGVRSLVPLQVTSIWDDLSRLDPDVHGHRLIPGGLHFDPVRARRERQRLRRAVKVLDLARVLTVDEDVRVVRRDLERHATVGGRARRDQHFSAWRPVAVNG